MRIRGWVLGSLATFAFALFVAGSQGNAKPKRSTWAAEGTVTSACQCDVFCACEFNGKPTAGHCDDVEFIEITKGNYGEVRLDGKRMTLVAQSPEGERMVDTIGKLNFARIYVDESVSDEEAVALAAVARKMFGTFVDGVDRISANETVHRAAMVAGGEGNVRTLSIPKILELKIEKLEGFGHKPIVIANHPFNAYGFGDPEVARSSRYTFTDRDGKTKWDYSGKNASVRTFEMSGEIGK